MAEPVVPVLTVTSWTLLKVDLGSHSTLNLSRVWPPSEAGTAQLVWRLVPEATDTATEVGTVGTLWCVTVEAGFVFRVGP